MRTKHFIGLHRHSKNKYNNTVEISLALPVTDEGPSCFKGTQMKTTSRFPLNLLREMDIQTCTATPDED